jgi:hypothetical protein
VISLPSHTIFTYNPADFQSMDNVSQTMMTERSLGMFTPLEISPEAFTTAYELPIGEHVEKNYKGLSYLSWPFAFRYLKEQFPALFVAFEESTIGWPVFGKEGCWLLRPYLTDGARRTPALVFPIMDNKHNAVKELDARQVSDNIQRASVKCIATFTGLGLKLYSGEDIPKADDEKATPKLPLQQETPKPVARPAEKAAPVENATPAVGTIESSAANGTSEFDGKAALLAFGDADPLGYGERKNSMQAVKAGLEGIGLSKGDDVKDSAMFANVITTMVTSWTKEKGIKITKAAMAKEIDALRAICTEGTVEQAIKGVQVFVQGKQ